jgi:hypothetical protein
MGYSDVPKPKVSRTTDNVEIRRASESGNPRGRSQSLAATPSERSGLKIRNAKPGLRGLIFDPALLAFSMLPPTQSPRPPSNAPSYQWCSCGLKIAKFSKSLKSESATCARTSATLISPITSLRFSTARTPPAPPYPTKPAALLFHSWKRKSMAFFKAAEVEWLYSGVTKM